MDFEHGYRLAAAILFPIALFGFTCNLTVVIFLRIMPSLKNSFGMLTFSQAFADCGHQAIFAFYFAPCLFLRIHSVYDLSEQFGFALILIYEICGMSHVCISVNRFCAVYFPFTYSLIFNKTNTLILVACLWVVGATSTTFMLKYLDCAFLLPQGMWIFIFLDNHVCKNVQWYGDFIKYVIYVAIVACLDSLSIVRIYATTSKHTQDSVASARRSRQLNLVWQAALQGIFFISELITYFALSPYAKDKWQAFFLTTISWCLVHGMDGFIVLACNRDFRRQICTVLRWHSRHSVSVTLNSNATAKKSNEPATNRSIIR